MQQAPGQPQGQPQGPPQGQPQGQQQVPGPSGQPSRKVDLPGGTEQETLAQISVTSRLPEFWKDKPRLWFIQFDAILANQKLGDDAKYNLVITKLTKDSIEQVTDILLRPPEKNKYSALKERLLSIYEESEIRKIQKLLSEIDLGEQKPSQLLRRMRDLARDKFSTDALRILWIGHLPPSVRAILTVSELTDLEKLAEMADKVIESTNTISSSAIAAVHSTERSTSRDDRIIAEISKLCTRMDNLERGRPQWRTRNDQRNNRSRSRGSSAQRRSSKSPEWLCFYHFRYGTKAAKCVKPCNWDNKNGQVN